MSPEHRRSRMNTYGIMAARNNTKHPRARRTARALSVTLPFILATLILFWNASPVREETSHIETAKVSAAWVTTSIGRSGPGLQLHLKADDKEFILRTNQVRKKQLENIAERIAQLDAPLQLVVPEHQSIRDRFMERTEVAGIFCGDETLYAVELTNAAKRETRVVIMILWGLGGLPILIYLSVKIIQKVKRWYRKRNKKRKKRI